MNSKIREVLFAGRKKEDVPHINEIIKSPIRVLSKCDIVSLKKRWPNYSTSLVEVRNEDVVELKKKSYDNTVSKFF